MPDTQQNGGELVRLTDGQLSFSAGVNSSVPRTKQLEGVPDGVATNQLAWGQNLSVRGGGISQRATLQPLVQTANWSGLYQGGMMYQPDYADPFLLLLIDGHLYQVRVDTDNSVVDLSTTYGHTITNVVPQAHFSQAEMFAVIQAGDGVTNPLFYDFGVAGIRAETLRQSNGFVGIGNATNEIPAAGPMDYSFQRLWYAFGRSYAAGDIVGNQTSGTAAFGYRDSVLHVTENPVAYSGDAFTVPTNAGDIRALGHAANLDTALGESNMFVFTRQSVYACVAPVTRTAWIATTNAANPVQKIALRGGGSYGDRCIVPVNGDLFFSGPPNGDIRSIQTALRYFGSWGNTPLSNNVERALAYNDRGLLSYTSGIQFDNRLLVTCLPLVTAAGVAHQAVIPLDFDVISSFEEKRPPAWEGLHDFSAGPYILQLFEGDFGGRPRAFAVVWSVLRSQIEVWELRPDLRFENGDARVTRKIEFPAYAFGNPYQLKRLDSGELWIDKLLGTVDFTVEYRPDGYGCWFPWCAFQKCAAKDCREDQDAPCSDSGYPIDLNCEQDMVPITLPKPPSPSCIGAQSPPRPADLGYQFQVRLTIKGWCRVRGFLLYATPRVRPPYAGLPGPVPSPVL